MFPLDYDDFINNETFKMKSLVSKDLQIYHLTERELSLSGLLSVIPDDTIYLDVSSDSMVFVVEYLKYKNGDIRIIPKPLKQTFKESCDIDDFLFIERLKTINRIDDIFLLADYFQIDSLLYLISAFISINLRN
jgi:hypothetical protein